jgi:DNA polymerase-3 subunit beta
MTRAQTQTEPLIIDRTVLAKNLAALTLACDSKQTIPVLSAVLLETKDDRLHMTATDIDVALECLCEVVAFAPVVAAVNAKLFASIISRATEDVQLQIAGTWLKVSYADTEMLLPITEKEHFPNIQRIEAGELELPAEIVRKVIGQTEYAIDKTEGRYSLQAGLLRYKDGQVEAIGNDGTRMAIASAEAEAEPKSFNLVIPQKALKVLYAVLEGRERVLIAQNDNLLRFDIDRMVLTVRKLARDFPNCDFVLGQLGLTGSVALNTKSFRSMIERMFDLRDNQTRHARITIENGWLDMEYVAVDRGQGRSRIAVEYAGEPIKFGVSVVYLREAVGVIDANDLTLRWSTNDKPIAIDAPGYRAVIMTIQPRLL